MQYNMLIAEDELDEFELVVFLLKKMKMEQLFRIFHAKNGKQAIVYLENEKIDLLLTDVQMPFMNGLEIATAARKQNPELPILFFSCYDDFSYVKTALTVKACNYLLKPLEPEEFERSMHEALEQIYNRSEKEKKMEDQNEELQDKNSNENGKKQAVLITKQYISQHYMEALSLNELADRVYLNASYLSSIFKMEEGIGISEYVKKVRMKQAKMLLEQTNKKVSIIAEEVGFFNTSYFIKSFHEYYGVTPAKLRQK